MSDTQTTDDVTTTDEGTQAGADDRGSAPGDEPKVYDESYVRRIRSESAGYRTRLRDAESRIEHLTAELEEARKGAESLAAAESRAAEAETKALRLQVVLGKSLPKDQVQRIVALADRLKGSTPEELEADAEALSALIGKPAAAVDFAQGVRKPVPGPGNVNDALRVLAFDR